MSAPLEQAELFVVWSLDEGSEHARRGHTYVCAEPDLVRWVSLEHSPATTPAMLELLTRWQAAHPPTPELELRRRLQWVEPAKRWRFTGDLGGVRELLATRALVHETRELEPLEADAKLPELPELPTAFLAGPIACLVHARRGPVAWPEAFEAPRVCVGPIGVVSSRAGEELVVCAARPGSIHAGTGQTRTAAVWCSHDGGAQWEELGWALDPDHERPQAWPPEQIVRVTFVGQVSGSTAAPVIEWEDPWSDWEAGNQWRGVWSPDERRWRVTSHE